MASGTVFLVERYLPLREAGVLEALVARLSDAAAAMRDEGVPVEWLRSIGLPEDETCLCLFRAVDEASVARLNRLAHADFDRISPAIALGEL